MSVDSRVTKMHGELDSCVAEMHDEYREDIQLVVGVMLMKKGK